MTATLLARLNRRRGGRPALVLAVTLAMTVIAALLSLRALQRAERLRFEKAAAAQQRSLQERIETHVDTLRAASGLFAAAGHVTRADFRRFFERMDLGKRYPGIRALGWSPQIRAANGSAVVSEIRASGQAGFRIWPEGARATHFPIAYLEPPGAEHDAALGFDMHPVPQCRAAMDRARDTGQAWATAKLERARLPQFPSGFLIYVPVYEQGPVPATRAQRRGALRGYVFAHVQLEPVIGIEQDDPLAIQVYDGRDADPERLLFRSHSAQARVSPNLVTARSVEAAGRRWTLRLAATPVFEREPYALVLLVVVVAGTLISLLLAGITWSESTARAGAEAAAAGLERSRDVLLEADHAKNRFLTVLGHELRNPLGAVSNALLVMRQRGLAAPQAERALQIAERQVAHQIRLVDDLLDVSRISTGKIELRQQPVDLRQIIERVIQAIAWQAAERRQELSVMMAEQAVVVDGDPARLEQVVWNLVANAIKYTPEGGTVQVGLERETRADQEEVARVVVRDSGIGLTAEERHQVFNMFAQAEPAASRAPGGLGIGLTLVEQIVGLHGGSVEAHSEGRDRGTEFSVRLPLSSSPSVTLASAGPPPASLGAGVGQPLHRVLVVEDNADAREMLCELLTAMGLRADAAPDGETGVELALQLRPQVVIIDLELPGINGFEVAKRIRGSEGGADAVLVALTGYGQSQERRRAAEVGFDDYLLKPLDVERLRAILCDRQAKESSHARKSADHR